MTTAAAKATTKKTAKPVKVSRDPSTDLRYHLRATTQRLLKEGFKYREAVNLMRQYLLSEAHSISEGEHTKAGSILGFAKSRARLLRARRRPGQMIDKDIAMGDLQQRKSSRQSSPAAGSAVGYFASTDSAGYALIVPSAERQYAPPGLSNRQQSDEATAAIIP